ncbi:MAG: sugar phosphate isomerase/epimerase family protein [Planctomycetota bacterium]
MLKPSAPDWCFLKPGIAPATHYARLKALGYGAVEMVAPENRATARDAGLQILNLAAPGMQQGLNHRAHHATLIPAIRDCISEAADAGIPQVIVFSGNRAGLSDGEGQANCIEALRMLAPEAVQAKVTLVIEMLNSFSHQDYQADRSAYGFAVAQAVASPAVKVLYDIYHMVRMGDDPVADIGGNLSLVAHLHLADVPKRTVPQADGKIAYRELTRQLLTIGYTGWWGMEFVPGGDVYAELEQAVAAVHVSAENCRASI